MGALLGTSAALFLFGVPIALAMGAGGLALLYMRGDLLLIGPATMFAGLDKTPIMAIPFFILAAEILSRGGQVAKLVGAIDGLIGHHRGGLAIVAVLATMIFSAVSGSSIATAAAIGLTIIPQMIERGYPQRFAVGLIAAAGGLGILIPPSIPMIIYGTVTGQSVGQLFQAGLVPGLLLGFSLCGVAVYYARKAGIGGRAPTPWRERGRLIYEAKAILLFPVVILGSIYGGIFTPSESSALAVVYALLITLPTYLRMGPRQLFRVIAEASATTAAILVILAGAALFGYAVTLSGITQAVVGWIPSLGLSRWQFLLLINLLFLFLGMFLEVISIILIAMPIIAPLLAMFDINPIHFCIIVVMNMEIAVITPPIGLNLFAIATISKRPVSEVFRGVVPFYWIILVNLLLITYIADISLFLSRVAPL
ncbi:MAG: TRAP transporter large permease [Geminicoccaceae bacterium]|nr:MAG: TRAP transporter large permease [Geminicoccaceae bacterium]